MSIHAKTVRLILDRAGDLCEHCGLTRPGGRLNIHHRLLRSAGGDNSVENLMVVTPEHHNVAPGSIHQEPKQSMRLGHIVRRGQDPALIPVHLAYQAKILPFPTRTERHF